MKLFFVLLSLIMFSVSCSSTPKEEHQERQEKAQEDYKEDMKESQEEYTEEQKEEAVEYIEEGEDVEIKKDKNKIDVIE
jgi:flagellar biosynthesis component FlhA